MAAKFQLKEDSKLAYTSRVTIQTNKPSLWSSATAMHMKLDDKECAAFIDAVVPGPDLILVDRLLRTHLDAKGDSLVDIEPITELSNAKEAVISISANWLGTIGEKMVIKNLLNKPFVISQQFAIPTIKGDELIVISKITPSPFAVITELVP